LYGRGVADDKSGVVLHAATLRAFGGRPPCTVVVLVEGMEETDSNLQEILAAHADRFDADLVVIADSGGAVVGEPALTTSLRGGGSCLVTVTTLRHAVHSGEFGGAAPDALLAMARLVARLHDDNGDLAVPGLTGSDWHGAELPDELFASAAGLVDGVQPVGTGSLGTRLWSRPSASVIGLDVPSVAGSSNVLHPQVRAKVSLRVPPGVDPARELGVLADFLRADPPWGVQVDVVAEGAAAGFAAPTSGPLAQAACAALEEAYSVAPGELGSGGSIPVAGLLAAASPRAEVVIWGAADLERSRIHSSDESVDPAELGRMIDAQVSLLERVGRLPGAPR
jgi:acetylornithine deacetylase/succinyl-diaminopimelate desuccinylase-like protein